MTKNKIQKMAEVSPTELKPARFETHGALLIVGLRGRYNAVTVHEIPALWQRFVPYIAHVSGMVGRTTYGVLLNSGSEDGFDYMAGVEVTNHLNLPTELEQVSIPAQQYAVFAHPEHVSKLKDTMSTIWHKWLPTSGQIAGEVPGMLERYGEGFDPETGMGDIEVWLPVRA